MKTRLIALIALAAVTLPSTATSAVIARGTFGPAGDHTGRGTVTVVAGKNGARYLKLSRTFAAFNAVKLNIYLATSPSARVRRNLGFLEPRGAQRFLVPSSLNLEKYRYVIAWCVAFNVPITQAILR
jgi:hypothetical protein